MPISESVDCGGGGGGGGELSVGVEVPGRAGGGVGRGWKDAAVEGEGDGVVVRHGVPEDAPGERRAREGEGEGEGEGVEKEEGEGGRGRGRERERGNKMLDWCRAVDRRGSWTCIDCCLFLTHTCLLGSDTPGGALEAWP
jgi:hypothetical protein